MSKKSSLIHQARQHERAARAEWLSRLDTIPSTDADDPAALEHSRIAEEDHRHQARQYWDEVQAIADAEDTREWSPEEPQWLVDLG